MKSVIFWKAYESEQPADSGTYIVLFYDGGVAIRTYSTKTNDFRIGNRHTHVALWAELPTPPEGFEKVAKQAKKDFLENENDTLRKEVRELQADNRRLKQDTLIYSTVISQASGDVGDYLRHKLLDERRKRGLVS